MSRLKTLVHRFYVPVASFCLVLAMAYWIRGTAPVDPLLAAQNKRIRFQTGGEISKDTNLTAAEMSLAESVLNKNRPPDGTHTELLYIGNSQSIAIMDQSPGDMISPQWLQVFLARQNGQAAAESKPIRVNLGSLPNLTAPELLVLLVAAGERTPRQADILVGSAVLEEFRGLGIRGEVAEVAAADNVKSELHSLVEENHDLATVSTSLQPVLSSAASPATTAKTGAAQQSLAQKLETKLQHAVERVPVFARRDDIRVQIALGYHESRNHLLGITSSSLRSVPDSSYRASLEMIELALRYAQSHKIRVVLYLAPIRPIQPNPNVPADVARFRRDVPTLCQRYGVRCLDYVDLVPEKLWTNYPDDATGSEGQRDFAHFTGAGHKLLAEKLMTDLGPALGSVQPDEKLSRR